MKMFILMFSYIIIIALSVDKRVLIKSDIIYNN